MAPKKAVAGSKPAAPKAKAKAGAKAAAKAAAKASKQCAGQELPPEQIRGHAGKEEAKALAVMTSEEWKAAQEGMKEQWPQPQYMLNDPQPGRPHTSYRDETYEIITRWMAETKIEYRPHAKSPGSKSHVRYEKYSKARTVGEALELGSWPCDWCWDYERGFIKATGPFRDEPIDPVFTFDDKALTPVDKAVYSWSLKELAKRCGLKLQDLRDDKNAGESAIMRAHRLVAQRTAKAALLAAKAEGRRVTDDEVTRTLQEWSFARNANRNNVMPDGRDWVWSDTLGLMRDRIGSIHITRATGKYPEVVELLDKWLTDRLPADQKHFKWTSLNLNKNYCAKAHRDGNNFGPSMIAAFGGFKGGQLNYWPEDNKEQPLETVTTKPREQLDLGAGLALFNGNCAHSVEPFQGKERFSVVYFTASCHARVHAEDYEALCQVGMYYPNKDEDPHRLLRAPLGYSGKDKPSSKLPAFRHWTRAELEVAPFKAKKQSQKDLQDWEKACAAMMAKSFGCRRPTGEGADETPEKAVAPGKGAKASKRASTAPAAAATKKQRTAKAGA